MKYCETKPATQGAFTSSTQTHVEGNTGPAAGGNNFSARKSFMS